MRIKAILLLTLCLTSCAGSSAKIQCPQWIKPDQKYSLEFAAKASLDEKKEGEDYASTASVSVSIQPKSKEVFRDYNDYCFYWLFDCDEYFWSRQLCICDESLIVYSVDFVDECGKTVFPSFHRYYWVDYRNGNGPTFPRSSLTGVPKPDNGPNIPELRPHDWNFVVSKRKTPPWGTEQYGDECIGGTHISLDLEFSTIYRICQSKFDSVTPRLSLNYKIYNTGWNAAGVLPTPIGFPTTWEDIQPFIVTMNSFAIDTEAKS